MREQRNDYVKGLICLKQLISTNNSYRYRCFNGQLWTAMTLSSSLSKNSRTLLVHVYRYNILLVHIYTVSCIRVD